MNKFSHFLRRFLSETRQTLEKLRARYKFYRKSKDYKLFDKKLIFSLSGKTIPMWSQLKLVGRFLSPRERLAVSVFSLMILVSASYILGNYYLEHRVHNPSYGGTYTEGLIGTPRYINPLYGSTSDADMDISKLMFSGLVKNDPERGIVNDLAYSYEISDDQKTYTFKLKENLKWHDGEELNADDVFFTVKAAQNADYASPLLRSFQNIEVEKIDDLTIRFFLKEPFAAFLNILTVGIMPEHIWGGITPFAAKLSEYNLRPIGSGPYKFKSFVRERGGNIRSCSLETNKYYFDKKPYIENITFRFYPNLEEGVNALNRNEVDGLSFFSKSYEEKGGRKKDIKYYSLNLPQYTAIFFNLTRAELLKDKAMRQTLAYAINKEKILTEILGNEGSLANGPIPRGFTGYHVEIKKYGFSAQTARENLEKLGWKIEEGEQFRKKGEAFLEITLVAPDIKEYINVAETVKADWEAIGIKTNLQIEPSSQIIQTTIKPRAYDILIYGEVVSAGMDLYPFWHSSQSGDAGLNLSEFKNREADGFLEKARASRTKEDKEKNLISFQNIVMEEMPAIFLYHPTYTYPVAEKVKGITIQRIGIPSDRFTNITNWFIKEKLGWKW